MPPAAVPPTAAESLEILDLLLAELGKAGLDEVTFVDVGDPLELRFGWQDRVTVLLGPKGSMAEKLKSVYVMLHDEGMIGQTERGTLNMRHFIATGRAPFSQE